MHVVVIDDQPRMVELVTSYLEEKGMRTTGCYDGETGLAAIAEQDPDAVVLDLMLPLMSGTGVCKALRAAGNSVPILMLTARGEVSERVAGLEAGADDYLVKPFALEELHARLRAIARRREERTAVLTAGDVTLDLGSRRVWMAGSEVTMARREFDMLGTLMGAPGRVVSRTRLYNEVWDGDETDLRSNSLEVYISRVRQHLRASTNVSITTMRAVGYRLDVRR